MANRKLGPYNLSDVLGRGGMGTVYRACHNETGEVCAVKALAPSFAEDDHFRSRFESEIQALLKLDHPNIVRLIGFGQEKGNLYFAMELVEGQSLFHRQRDGHRFDWREVLSIGKDIAKGLRHAHDRGIIHRDLKPGNLLRSESGIIKITDFGIAKSFGASQITGTNILGTMDFMSPEQAQGEPVTMRSDLYSLGTVMFTLLVGRPPFVSNSVEESVRNLTSAAPPAVSDFVPDVPDEMSDLILKLMAKRPGDRIATALALLHKIDEIEKKLRYESEAQTAKHQAAGDTFDIALPAPAPSKSAPTQKIEKATQKNTRIVDDPSAGTVVNTKVNLGGESVPSSATEKPDFYSNVDQSRRNQIPQVENEPVIKTKGFWVLAGSFFIVVMVAIWGSVIALRPPSADALYEKIEANQYSPEKVRKELVLFEQLYSEDDRIDIVVRLKEEADANSFHNRLAVRANRVGRSVLSEIERHYFKLFEQSKHDPIAAHAAMKNFITLYGNDELPSEADQECLKAARIYLRCFAENAKQSMEFHRDRISDKLEKASELPLEQAIEIYEAIIAAYKEDSEIASDLVEKARLKLETAKKKLGTVKDRDSKE